MIKPLLLLVLILTLPSAWPVTPHTRSKPVLLVVGNDLWQPGKKYIDGSDWLAMVCQPGGCTLEPASLKVRAESWQGHYDDKPTRGQKLHFTRNTKGQGKVIAWLRKNPALDWLEPGPVKTYASNAVALKRPPTEGTLETAVDLPDGSMAIFVPLLDNANSAFQLQLRMPGRRQMLGPLGSCSQAVSLNYFMWAGDLDRDGRPDFLVSFVDADGQVILYLSSAAAPNEIAGAAGVFDAPPYGGECDGGGWLNR